MTTCQKNFPRGFAAPNKPDQLSAPSRAIAQESGVTVQDSRTTAKDKGPLVYQLPLPQTL